ncbi:hypothetical protein CRG98_040946 [Punica granatum]|uniref:Uncharacterized protein n=1 Tax=Punica granatum TaxID=22663 RepID=A0A2I0I4P7_PUNGR|nr:hypothetical protein CRG98_040946 [Punica granatum]
MEWVARSRCCTGSSLPKSTTQVQMKVMNALGPDMTPSSPIMARSASMMAPLDPVMPPQVSNIPRQMRNVASPSLPTKTTNASSQVNILWMFGYGVTPTMAPLGGLATGSQAPHAFRPPAFTADTTLPNQ